MRRRMSWSRRVLRRAINSLPGISLTRPIFVGKDWLVASFIEPNASSLRYVRTRSEEVGNLKGSSDASKVTTI